MTTEIVVTEKSVESEPPISTSIDPVPLAEAAVEVARIEGETQIALAEIAAEAAVTQAEAVAEVSAQHEGENEWQRSIENQIAEMREAQQLILSRLTPPDSSPPNPENENGVVRPEAESPPTPAAEETPKPNKRRWI